MARLACAGVGGAEAAAFLRCTKAQISTARAAIRDAGHGCGGGGDGRQSYARWFGRWDEEVRQLCWALRTIGAALASDGLHVVCPALGPADCPLSIIAWAMPDDVHEVNVCPAFLPCPACVRLSRCRMTSRRGVRGDDVEVTHSDLLTATGDHCYRRTDCGQMARRTRSLPRAKPTALQYLAEDIALSQQGG